MSQVNVDLHWRRNPINLHSFYKRTKRGQNEIRISEDPQMFNSVLCFQKFFVSSKCNPH